MTLNFLVLFQRRSLENDLSLVEQWCVDNSMQLNVLKCAVIHFGNHNPNCPYFLNGFQIPIVSHYKDLGVIIDSRFSFQQHLSFISKKCSFLSRVVFRSFTFKSTLFLSKIFRAYLLPSIIYGFPLFHLASLAIINKLEDIQKKFTRSLFSRSSAS